MAPVRAGAWVRLWHTHRMWEHFLHRADIGVRGAGATPAEAFAEAARALTAVITDLEGVRPAESVGVCCAAPNVEILLVDWLNAIVFEMSTRRMLFCRFEVKIEGDTLRGKLWGEPVDRSRHRPAVEIKGATFTELTVKEGPPGCWTAQCVVDV